MPRRSSYASVRPVIQPIDGATEGARGDIETSVTRGFQEIDEALTADRDREISAEAVSVTQADARRTMPRAATDNLNEQSGVRLVGEGQTIQPPSIYSHRMNRRNSNLGVSKFTVAEDRDFKIFLNPQDDRQRAIRDFVTAFAKTGQSPDTLSRRKRAFVKRIDRAIQKAEAENDRIHVINMPLQVNPEVTKEDFINALRDNPDAIQTFNGFSRGNHDINKVTTSDEDEIVVQLETARGMYLGSRGNSSHLLPRGVRARFVAVRELPIQRADGTTYTRTVVQLREETEDN